MRYWLENIKEKIEDFFTNIKYRLGGLTSVFINNKKYIFFKIDIWPELKQITLYYYNDSLQCENEITYEFDNNAILSYDILND